MKKILLASIFTIIGFAVTVAQTSPANVVVYKKDTAFTSIAIDDNGNVFAGTNGKGLWKYDQSTWKNWSGFGIAFTKSNIRQIAIKGNNLWVASSGYVFYLGSGEAGNNMNFYGGVLRIDTKFPNARTYYRGRPVLGQNPAQGPPTRNVLGLYIDSTGTPWCAASYHDSMTYPAFLNYNSRYHFAPGAVGRYNGSNFSFIKGADLPEPTGILIGVGNNYQSENYSIGKRRTCRSIVQAGAEVWVGSDGYDAGSIITAGILRYDMAGNYIGKFDQNNTPVPFGITNSDFGPWAMCKDAKGRVWASMNGFKGIAVYDTAGWHYIGVPATLPAATVFRANSITGSTTGEVYFGTSNGLLVYKGVGDYTNDSSYKLYTTTQGLSSNSIFGIAVGKDGSIWACTGAGVNKIKTGDLAIYTLKPNSTNSSITDDDRFRRLIAMYDSKKPQSEIDKDTLFISADGSKATILKWTGSDSKNLQFRIKDGSAAYDPEQHGSFMVRYLNPLANDSIRLQYTHPSYINDLYTVSTQFNGKAVRMLIVDTTLSPEKIVLDIPVKFMLPPVLMLHGLWSDATTWDKMKAYLLDNGIYNYKDYQLSTPSYLSDREFTYNRAFIASYIDKLIEDCGKNRFSAGKVDIVSHSMGGILSRLYLQEGNGAGPYKKDIHKLITINTPHSGSPLANIVEDKDDFFRWVLKKVGKDPYKGALNNLAIGKAPIDSLLNGPDLNHNIVPSHAIHSNDDFGVWAEKANGTINDFITSPIKLKPTDYFSLLPTGQGFGLTSPVTSGAKMFLFSVKYWFTKNTSCPWNTAINTCLEQIYKGKNDLIVSDESQVGGMTDANTLFSGYNHLNVQKSAPIYFKVLSLFRENVGSPLFSTNGFHPAKLKWNPVLGTVAGRPAGIDSVKIISPAYGAFYNRGDSVLVTIRASNGIKRILFGMGYENDVDAFAVQSPDSLFRFKVPADVVNEIDFKIFGFDDFGNESTDSSLIRINPGVGVTLDSIRFVQNNNGLVPQIPIGDSTSFSLYGFYSDGSIRNITYEPGVSFTSGGGGISNSSPAAIKGLVLGFDELQATYAGAIDTLVVEVVPLMILEAQSPLPVSFTAINAQFVAGKVLVKWTTAQEYNNNYFMVEHSTDGRNFNTAGSVAAYNLAQGSQYQFADPGYKMGKNYYRIKQLDKDGRFSYSAIATILISAKGNINIYPNPATDKLVINAANLQQGNHSIRIINTMGQSVFIQSFNSSNNSTNVDIARWPSGIYWIELSDANKQRIITTTFLKN
jgi:pimeloyl-ACP methyl ester carboxylesterase